MRIIYVGDTASAFQRILTEAKAPGAFSGAHSKYLRVPEVSKRTKKRRAKGQESSPALQKNTKSLLDIPGFCLTRPDRVLPVQPTASSREEDADSEATFGEEISEQEREEGIKALGKKMRPGVRRSVPI